jgi:hypothetical protein
MGVRRSAVAHEGDVDLRGFEVRQQGDWVVLACTSCCPGTMLASWKIAVGLEELASAAYDHRRREIRE